MTLEKGITGLINIPPDLEIIFHNIYEGKVPDQWLKSIIIYSSYILSFLFFSKLLFS